MSSRHHHSSSKKGKGKASDYDKLHSSKHSPYVGQSSSERQEATYSGTQYTASAVHSSSINTPSEGSSGHPAIGTATTSSAAMLTDNNQCLGSFQHFCMDKHHTFTIDPHPQAALPSSTPGNCNCKNVDVDDERSCMHGQLTAVIFQVTGGYAISVIDGNDPWMQSSYKSATEFVRDRKRCITTQKLLRQVVDKKYGRGVPSKEVVFDTLNVDLDSKSSAVLKTLKNEVCDKMGKSLQVTIWTGDIESQYVDEVERAEINIHEENLKKICGLTGFESIKYRSK